MIRHLSRLLPSPGAQSLALAYLATACFGVIFATIVILRLDGTALLRRSLTLYEIWIVASGAVGGMSGLRIGLPFFGTGSMRLTLLGMGVVTFAAPLVAGSLALPLYGTMFGPFTLVLILAASPILASLWAVTLLGVDRLVLTWTAERDSIFGARPPEPLFSIETWRRRITGRA